VGTLWDILYDLLFQPRLGMATIAQQKNAGQAILVVLTSILVPLWALSFGMKDTGMTTMIHIVMGIHMLGSLVVWVLASAIWHLVAEFLGGKGRAVGLFAALGFAQVPRLFIVPLWALITVMPPSSKTVLMALAVLVILGWSLFLDVIAIKEVHQLSTSKAVIVIIMPMLLVGLLCLLGLVFISSSLLHMNMWT
jgi:hypothetical protein